MGVVVTIGLRSLRCAKGEIILNEEMEIPGNWFRYVLQNCYFLSSNWNK